MRNRSTIEFIGLWEQFNNPMSGSNSFSLTPKRWIEATNSIGIVSKTQVGMEYKNMSNLN